MKRHGEQPASVGKVGELFRRLLRASVGFQESVSLQERDAHVGVPRNSYYNYQEEIKTALLRQNAERLKQSNFKDAQSSAKWEEA